jgi:hypothetical protein
MYPGFPEIENEFAEIAREVDHLRRCLTQVDQEPAQTDAQARWQTSVVCASTTEKIYMGLERVMSRIARDIDRAPMSRTGEWHLTLLKQVAAPFPGIRPAVISAEWYRGMDTIRAFRHRARYSYSLGLDYDIVVQRGHEAIASFLLFRQEVRDFFTQPPGAGG